MKELLLLATETQKSQCQGVCGFSAHKDKIVLWDGARNNKLNETDVLNIVYNEYREEEFHVEVARHIQLVYIST